MTNRDPVNRKVRPDWLLALDELALRGPRSLLLDAILWRWMMGAGKIVLNARARTIAGESNEISRNLILEPGRASCVTRVATRDERERDG